MWSWWGIASLLVALLALPLASPGLASDHVACDELRHADELYLPSGPLGPMTLPEERLTNRIFVWIHGPTSEVNHYTLEAANEPVQGRIPDFNMAFYEKSGGRLHLVATHNDVGDQSGTFPPGDNLYVGVYMAYPDRPVTSKFHITLECVA